MTHYREKLYEEWLAKIEKCEKMEKEKFHIITFLGLFFIVSFLIFMAVKLFSAQGDSRIPGLVACWHMNEGSGTLVRGEKGHNGTIYNSVAWVDGKFGKALHFAAGNNYVEVPHSTDFDFDWNTPVSFSFWVKLDGTTTTNWILSKNSLSGTHSGWNVTIESIDAEELNLSYHNVRTTSILGYRLIAYGDTNILPGRWYHLVVTYNGNGSWTGVKFYINSNLDTTKVVSGYETNKYGILSTLPVRIGGRTNPGYEYSIAGVVDDILIFKRVLSPAEVKKIYYDGLGRHTKSNE
jgi:hypothetical protein